MPKTFCLLNHELTQKQIAELNERFGSQEIFYPKEELSKLWSQILPEESNDKIIKEVVFWLEKNASLKDIFVIQGEFGSTFTLVDFALKKGLVPLYATTRRIAKETRTGETVHREYVFEHVCFKKYDYFKEL
ncbi:MAG: CRISPR-associated protein Csx20 [Treponema sp.]|nr:CRISPR-associated protein Csx20 [Treponema sp.]